MKTDSPVIEKTIVLNDGEPFQTEEAIRALMHSVFGAVEIPAPFADDLLRAALEKAPRHPALTWKEALQSAHGRLVRQRYLPGVTALLDNLFGSAKGWPETVTPQLIEALQCCLREHQALTEANRRAYRGDDSEESRRRTYWPDPTHAKHPRSLFDEAPLGVRHSLIDRKTPIVSAGSCFAMEIAHWLQDNGFNYVVTDRRPTGHRLPISSARWGIIFNAPSFRQLVEHAFGIRSTPRILWKISHQGQIKYADPFREDILFDTVEEYDADYEVHRANTRRALETCDVFILTLGMGEVWHTRNSDFYCSRCNWGVPSELVNHRLLTVDEIVENLETMLGHLRRHNPGVKLIISVSPVPLHATFRGADQSVITANSYSKALQRVAVDLFVSRNRDVFYLPAYESVLYCTPDAWQADQRHVSREAVARVMKLFTDTFVKQ